MKKDEPTSVSVKINGTYVEKKATPEKESEKKEELPIIDWNERRAAENEAAAFKEAESEKRRPGLPLKANRKKKKNRIPGPERKKKQPLSLYFISLTAGAAVLGLIFGITLLQFVSAGDPTAGTEPQEEPPPITADFNDSLTAYIIQAGAFSQKEKGLQIQASLTDQGYPGILTYDEEYYYLFCGIYFQKEDAEQMLNYYKDEGIEVFEKTRSIPDPEKTKDDPQTADELLQVKQLLTDTVNAGDNIKAEDDTLKALSALLEASKSWKEEAFVQLKEGLQLMEEEWPEDEAPSAAFQESLMETVLYYEQAVYVYNGEDTDGESGKEEDSKE